MQKQIKVTINPVGKPTIEAVGFNGQGCEAATAGMERTLGGTAVEDKEFKPEYVNVDQSQTNTATW